MPRGAPKGTKPKSVWKPGQSGNPGGRPKGIADLAKAAREHTPAALQTLVRALNDPKLGVTAAIALLDRGWGKAPLQITVDGDLTLHRGGIDAPPDIPETREEWLARRQAEIAQLLEGGKAN